MRNLSLLVADDSAPLRRHLIEVFDEMTGVEVAGEAENAKEAVCAIRTLQPDIVILDIRMPPGNGIEVLKTIGQDRHQPIVIMLSNYAAPPYRDKSMRAGASFFFDKASELEELKQTVSEIVLKSRAGMSGT